MYADYDLCSTLGTFRVCQKADPRRRFNQNFSLYQGRNDHVINFNLNSKNSVQVLSDPSSVITQIFAEESRKALSNLLIARGDPSKKEKVEKKVTISQPDEPIQFAQLMVRDGSDALEDELQKSLMAAVSGRTFQMPAESSGKLIILGGPAGDKQDPLQSKLNKVEQLTGFSDPVYAEAYVNVNQYDIVLDVLVVNQTADTLQVHILRVPRPKTF